MGKKESLRSISERLGLSPSTVYRALNSCGDVSSETASRIRQLVSDGESRVSKWDILDCAIILPAKPNYFGRTCRTYFDNNLKNISHRFFLYSDPTDEKGFCSTFGAVASLHPRIAIVVAPNLPTVRNVLEKSPFPIFFFSESVALVNSFFFGSDPYGDGAVLGKTFSRRFPQCRSLLYLRSDGVSSLSDRRREGFLAETTQLEQIQTVPLEGFFMPYLASLLARRLSEAKPFDSIFCDTGILPELCLALQKCNIPTSVPCVGFEDSPALDSYRKNGRSLLISAQNFEEQANLCSAAVRTYLDSHTFPDRKFSRIPSFIICPSCNIDIN